MTNDSEFLGVLRLLSSGQIKLALKKARQAARKNPRNPDFPNLMGIALGQEGKLAEAVAAFSSALKLAPGFTDARRNLAQTLMLIGKTDAALRHFEVLCNSDAADHVSRFGRAQACLAAGDAKGAEHSMTEAIKIAPGTAKYLMLRARAREALGDTPEAICDITAAIELEPENPDILTDASVTFSRNLRADYAMELLRRAVAVAPNHAPARLRLGMQALESGDLESAREAFQQTLQIDPTNGYAREQLVLLQSPQDNAAQLGDIKAKLLITPQTNPNAAPLGFALAHVAAQSGDKTLMREALAQANGVLSRQTPYDAITDRTHHDRVMACKIAFADRPSDGPRPIFIVGLPRSGTTLVETLIAGHSDVLALGEQAAVGIHADHFLRNGSTFGPEEAGNFAARYRHTVPVVPDTYRAFTDKMPENYRYLGFIKAAFPDARMILVHRDPRDIALSMWRTHFSGTALNYTYNLSAMANRFNLFARTLAHWNQMMPDAVLHLHYEDLVADIDTHSRELAAFCGLDWQERMARPQDATLPVMTRSAGQVRQKAHQRSVGGWMQHTDMLHPFIKRLDPDLWPQIRNA